MKIRASVLALMIATILIMSSPGNVAFAADSNSSEYLPGIEDSTSTDWWIFESFLVWRGGW